VTCILVWCMLLIGHTTTCERPLKVTYFEEPFVDSCRFTHHQLTKVLAEIGGARAVYWDHTLKGKSNAIHANP